MLPKRPARQSGIIKTRSRKRSRRLPLRRINSPQDSFKFAHSRLDTSRKTIRLLRITPNVDASSISCTLQHFPINEVTYTCLSYTWGDEGPEQTIYIHGLPFLVGQNLYDFLHQARATHNRDFLWIDAICIDQENVDERNHQVALMSSIYSQAECVIVWLGKGDSHIQQLFQIIQDSGSGPNDNSNKSSQSGYAHNKDGIRKCTESMEKLNALPYWSRLWIMQEIALSRRKIVQYGNSSISWADFARFWMDISELSKDKYPGAELRNILELGDGARKRFPISYLISMTTSMQCRDGRDRIYGILGIARGCESFKVDYSAKSEELFCRALELFIPDQNAGDPLAEFQNYFEDLWFVLKLPAGPLQLHVASRYQLFLDDTPILSNVDDESMNFTGEYRSVYEILSRRDFRELGRLVISGDGRSQAY